MYMHAARFNARLDQKGGIIIFKDQDRNLWDKEMIQAGLYYLEKAATGETLSEYHLEAGIAAEHCLAESYATTNWQNIYHYYKQLFAIKQNSIIELNMAIISSQTDSIEASIKQLLTIEEGAKLNNYYLLSATLGTFYFDVGNMERAKCYFQKALDQTQSKTERDFLTQYLAHCK